ncbi:MAG: SGNH/GDSL hydrolase family protein [Acidobacteriota bacterium]
MLPVGRRLALALVTVILVFGAAETALRIAGFTYQPYPDRIWLGRYAGGIPTADVVFDRVVPGLFTRDARLFWRPVAGKAPFNAAGLRDPDELPAARLPGEVRILALGDSCTFLGEPDPWTEVLARRLAGRGRRIRVLNAGVPAWSSLQGRRYLEDPGLTFQPDIVLVYFGWNDHWRATVKPDAAFPVPRETVVSLQRFLGHLRLYQALNRLLAGRAAAGGQRPPGPETDLARTAASRPFRVPVADFEQNLEDIARLVAAHGGKTVFITAPSFLFSTAVPRYLFVHGFVASGGEPIESIHARYAAVVRRVAEKTGAVLVDAAQAFAAAPDAGRALLREDGIHLTHAGIERLAALLDRQLTAAGLLPAGR